ncbi:32675_t:CDS:1, partial [Racocetra persica]
EKYLRVRPEIQENDSLFLNYKKKKMTAAAISTVIKWITDHIEIKECFTAYSLRIREATAAMKGGMSLTQIKAIGG